MDEIRFHPIRFVSTTPLSSCRLCGGVIVDDDERANRADHVAQHERVERLEVLVRALIDGKQDA
jgi:hypothetical protein